MESAVHRVFATPELLQEILLQIPITAQENGFPDLQLSELQRVDTSFRDAISNPGKLNRRMLEGYASSSDPWAFLDYLVENNVWPPMQGHEPRRKIRGYTEIVSETHMKLEFEWQCVWLHAPGRQWRCPASPGGPASIEDMWQGKIDEKYAYPEASWRRISLHPTLNIEAVLYVNFLDEENRLEGDKDNDEMAYHFYSGGPHERMALGDLYDLFETIRQFTPEQHLWMYEEALYRRTKRQNAHRAALAKVGDHSHDGDWSVPSDEDERCDVCEKMWLDAPPPECQWCLVGNCLHVASSSYANSISISWPTNRKLFEQVKEVGEEDTTSQSSGEDEGEDERGHE